jgi:hypothetical protein
MTDLLAMLRKIQNLKPGDMMPEEWGPGEWGTPLSKLCGEAADEIERLRCHDRASEKWLAELVPVKVSPQPNPEPWGSPYAMNPENWK